VQIVKSFGAEVTGVCSTRNLELVRSLGADHVVDYTKEDFVQSGQQYDLIVATAGYRSIFDYRRALSPQGIYVSTGGAMAQTFQGLLLGPILSMFGDKKLGSMLVEPNKDLDFITELIESGKVKPVVDRRYPLNEAAQALSYYAEGHARGKVVIIVEHDAKERTA
jgi:NADPH:quinone reductase-like Zn-dependent oxidoreductase